MATRKSRDLPCMRKTQVWMVETISRARNQYMDESHIDNEKRVVLCEMIRIN